MRYFIFTLLFALQVLGANTLVLPKQISVPAGSVLVGNSTGVGTTTPVGISGQFLQSQGTGIPVWKNIQGGLKNYITNGDAESSTTGWVTYSDTADVAPVDGVGGTASVTWATSATNPLELANSFIFTKDAANRQGQGASYAFTIDREDQAKVMNITASYLVNSGTFTAGSASDLRVWIYDVTNATLIQPSSYTFLSNGTSVADKFSATFQTASNSTSYRLIFHVSTTSASAYSLKFDSIKTGPSQYVYGTPITSWVAFTPSLSTGVLGTGGQQAYRWRRVGSNMEIYFNYEPASAGTAGSGAYNITVPNSYTIDTSVISSGNNIVGKAYLYNGSSLEVPALVTYSSTTSIGMKYSSSLTAMSVVGSSTFPLSNSGTRIHFEATIPIVGWDSTTQMSDQTDTRVVAAKVAGSASSSGSGTVIAPSATIFDTHNAYSAGRYTVQVPGYYKISGTLIQATGGAHTVYLYTNAVQGEAIGALTGATTPSIGFSTIVLLSSGQIVDVRANAAATYSNFSLSIERISGSSTISATDSIQAKYMNTAGTAVSTSYTTVIFATKIYDSNAWYNTSTGVYTVGIPGKYRVTAKVVSQAVANSTSNSFGVAVKVTSTPEGLSGSVIDLDFRRGNGVSLAQFVNGSAEFYMFAGDTFEIQVANPLAVNLSTAAGANTFSISRIGN